MSQNLPPAKSRKGLYIGIGIGVVLILLLFIVAVIGAVVYCYWITNVNS